MALAAFQQALCELIASPETCLSVRADPAVFLSRYDLSDRERERLQQIVWQPGMSTSCTLYRSNRVTPVFTLLHNTCVLLGDSLKEELEEYWRRTELRNLEFKLEIERFAEYLRQRVAEGAINDPLLEEVLEFELVVNELRFAPRQAVHPPARLLRFSYDMGEVLSALAQGHRPTNPTRRDTTVMLAMVDGSLRATEGEGTFTTAPTGS